jgi:hypothetical protein
MDVIKLELIHAVFQINGTGEDKILWYHCAGFV